MIAIYVRQSVDKKDSISIESQIDFCRREINGEEYRIYSDKGYSGSNINRPAFEEMMDDIKNQLISKVIVYKLDRISRSLLDFAHIIEHFNKYNVEFISYTEKFDTSQPMGRAMLSIIMVFAQLERETIQKRVTDNYYTRGEKGFYLGGKAPFGYNKIKTTLDGKKTYTFEENKYQSEIIRLIYNMYANNDKSLGNIVNYLNKLEIKTNKDNYWTSVSVSKILRNPIYVMANEDVYLYLKNKGATMNNNINLYNGKNACFIYGDRKKSTKSKFSDLTNCFVTLSLHQGLIPADVWLECQYIMDKNKRVKNYNKGTHSWLTGLMKCGYCGYAITVVNGYKDILYINCSGRKMKICDKKKRVMFVKDIESLVEIKLLEKIKSTKIQRNPKLIVNTNLVEINRLKIELDNIENKIQEVIDSILTTDIKMEYINKKIYTLDKRKKEILKKIDELMVLEKHKNKGNKELSEYLNNWYDYNTEEKKSVARILIDKVTITDDDIEIYFNI